MADPDYLKGLGVDVNALMSSPKGSGITGSGTVYFGPKATLSGGSSPSGPYAPGFTPKFQDAPGNLDFTGSDDMPYESARMMPLEWDAKKARDFISKGILYKMPGFSSDMGMPEVMAAWDDLLQSSMAFSSKGGNKWTPWDVMESYKKEKGFGTVRQGDWLYDIGTGQKIKYVGPKSKTRTQKSINLSSPEDVRALTSQMLSELLGRAPTPEELSKYRAAINGEERANPEITKVTDTFDDQGEVVSSSSTTSGGVSQAAMGGLIESGVKKGPEYGKHQSATTYFDAMMQMIEGG